MRRYETSLWINDTPITPEELKEQQATCDYQKGWNDAACKRINHALTTNHAYRMGRADRESYRAANR